PKKDESLLRSSISRYEVGSKLLLKVKEKTPQAALDILSSLEAKPYSILMIDKRRRGRTLFTTLFDVSDTGITMKVYEPKPKIQEKDSFLELTSDDLT
ncbi:MAG: C45 family peptidase, partial [Candidatus Bathyarchaeota archaeon]|nr:C45 family peptidase [Candidatus Bathyarchaeota archaeon]